MVTKAAPALFVMVSATVLSAVGYISPKILLIGSALSGVVLVLFMLTAASVIAIALIGTISARTEAKPEGRHGYRE